MVEYSAKSLHGTELIAEQIANKIGANDVIALNGGLGAGKTTFTRYLVKCLGSLDLVSSPTFSLVNHYKSKPEIFHFDMYRIKTEYDLYSIGFFDYMDDGNILIIEWSENIIEFLPPNVIEIYISVVDEYSRNFKIISRGDDRF